MIQQITNSLDRLQPLCRLHCTLRCFPDLGGAGVNGFLHFIIGVAEILSDLRERSGLLVLELMIDAPRHLNGRCLYACGVLALNVQVLHLSVCNLLHFCAGSR